MNASRSKSYENRQKAPAKRVSFNNFQFYRNPSVPFQHFKNLVYEVPRINVLLFSAYQKRTEWNVSNDKRETMEEKKKGGDRLEYIYEPIYN